MPGEDLLLLANLFSGLLCKLWLGMQHLSLIHICIPNAFDKKHGRNNRRVNAENVYKKVSKIRRHECIAHIPVSYTHLGF